MGVLLLNTESDCYDRANGCICSHYVSTNWKKHRKKRDHPWIKTANLVFLHIPSQAGPKLTLQDAIPAVNGTSDTALAQEDAGVPSLELGKNTRWWGVQKTRRVKEGGRGMGTYVHHKCAWHARHSIPFASVAQLQPYRKRFGSIPDRYMSNVSAEKRYSYALSMTLKRKRQRPPWGGGGGR